MIDFSKPPEQFIEDHYDWWGYKYNDVIGSVSCECHYYHRDDGPAEIKYYDHVVPASGISSKYSCRHVYFVHDKEHRVDGPAAVWLDQHGNVVNVAYYLLGHIVNKEEFDTPGFIDAFILENS